ncbi:MAG: hypothetical protein AB7L13_23895 [Acidimicrobiia bacterium]
MDQLVTAQEIADHLGLSHPDVVHNWRRRHPDFPSPVIDKGHNVRLWFLPDVEKWAKANDRWPAKPDE